MATTEYRFRPDAGETLQFRGDSRSRERLLAHYALERDLARQLRDAPQDKRQTVYSEVYNKLFSSLPDHTQRTVSSERRQKYVALQIGNVHKYINENSTFLEIGCGDGELSIALAKIADKVIGLDVSSEIIGDRVLPENVEFILIDGLNFPIESNTVDCAFSDQLLEHIHPEDARKQVSEVCRVLKPGAIYWMSTPSRFTGPHDISRYFDYSATCFHLREYDYRSVTKLMRSSGFRKVRFLVGKGTRKFAVPSALMNIAETFASILPQSVRKKFINNKIAISLFGISAVAFK